MSEKGRSTFTAQVFGETLESLNDAVVDKNSAHGMPIGLGTEMLDKRAMNTKKNNTESLEGTYFTPHPPEKPRDSSESPQKVKNKRRFTRRSNRVVGVIPNSQSSDDEKFIPEGILDNRTSGSKLPSLSRYLNHENDTNIVVDKNLKHLNPLILNKKPLSPIKDNEKLADNFKTKQSLERRKYIPRSKGPLKSLDPSESVSTLQLNKTVATVNATNVDSNEEANIDVNSDNDKSENTLTSISSDDSSDSDHESSSVSNSGLKPHAPSNLPPSYHGRRRTLSLNSVKDYAEQQGRHSDTEAIRRERLGNGAALLPRVTVAMARDRNSNFVKEELEKYLPGKKLLVFIGTWNMHGEKVTSFLLIMPFSPSFCDLLILI